MSNSPIWPIERTLSAVNNLGQSESGSNGNERVLCTPQSSSIAEALPSDCSKSYSEQSLGSLDIYNFKHILRITFLNEPELVFVYSEMVSSILI